MECTWTSSIISRGVSRVGTILTPTVIALARKVSGWARKATAQGRLSLQALKTRSLSLRQGQELLDRGADRNAWTQFSGTPPRFPLCSTVLLCLLTLCAAPQVWAQATLENPASASYQSGIGLISGWACNATRIEIAFNGGAPQEAAYGTSRGDTQGVCGDADNGFGLLFNWNLLGDGTHTVAAAADGVEFARVEVTVTTLGGAFQQGLSGEVLVPNFPEVGTGTVLRWQQVQQNFVISYTTPPKPAAATLESVDIYRGEDFIHITWNEVIGAEEYGIFVADVSGAGELYQFFFEMEEMEELETAVVIPGTTRDAIYDICVYEYAAETEYFVRCSSERCWDPELWRTEERSRTTCGRP